MNRKSNWLFFWIIFSFALIGLACSGISIQMDPTDEAVEIIAADTEAAETIATATETPGFLTMILTAVFPQNPNSTATGWSISIATVIPAVIPQLPLYISETGIVGIDIELASGGEAVLSYYDSGRYYRGSSQDLAGYDPWELWYSLPGGKSPDDIIDIAYINKNEVLFYYLDGTVSFGVIHIADERRSPERFTLPPGKNPGDIVGIAGTCNQTLSETDIYAWYKDGTVSSGTHNILDKKRAPYPYSLPPGKTPADIIAIGIACSDDHVYVWYSDMTVSSGNSSDLDLYRDPQPFTIP